jgi:uncharacterized membrane protein YdjX (TVP38/TMEM64 family)
MTNHIPKHVEGEPVSETITPTSPPVKQKLVGVSRILGFMLVIAITVSIFVFRDQLKQVGNYGYIGIFLISVIGNATIILPAPTFLTAFAGGSIFSPFVVGIIAAAGATVGELTGYLAGVSGQAIVENQKMFDRFQHWMQSYGLLALFVLAVIPNPFFDVAGIIAGISRIPLAYFLLITWAGKIIKFLIIAYLGAGSIELLERLLG